MTKFQFKPEPTQASTKKNHYFAKTKYWHILLVDDEQSVHDVTDLVMSKFEVFGRQVKLHNAYSAQEAKEMLNGEIVFAMAFIDVVMETDDAGLELVTWIRKVKNNQSIRLVLRTGHPGFAPEEEVILKYDINDYKTKTELTELKMFTSVCTGIRGYCDIETILRSLNALKKLIEASTNILKITELSDFATAALNNLLALMNLESSAIYIVRQEVDFQSEIHETLLASTGRFDSVNDRLDTIPAEVKTKIDRAFNDQKSISCDDHFIGFFQTSADACAVLYLEFEDDPVHFKAGLAELFATNLALVLESLVRQHQLSKSHRELMYIVGDAIEARSKETGSHVQRVALLCELIAQRLGMSEAFIQAIKIAAPLHDIGKIAIADNILHKADKLDPDEWKIMQTHSTVGANLLAKSDLPVAKMGANLARYHHENWDGSGYPTGLSGLNIPLESRILAIADVIDALGTKRSYKDAWPSDKILDFINAEKGLKFEPKLVDLVVDCFDELTKIRDAYPD